MHDVLMAAIWPVALLIGWGMFLAILGHPVAAVLYARRALTIARSEQNQVDVGERKRELELAPGTLAERTELRKAELRRQAAEMEAAAEVARGTVDAQIAAERQVIAAAAEGRAEAAKERALSGGGNPNDMLGQLLAAYDTFQRKQAINRGVTFDEWLGNIDLPEQLLLASHPG